MCSTLGLSGPSGVSIMAEGGEMSLSAYRDIKIGSSEGQVRSIQIIPHSHNFHPQVILNTGAVLVPRLPILSTNISANNYSKYPASKDITIYQVGINIVILDSSSQS